MAHRGICIRHKAENQIGNWDRSASGQKICQICEMFIEWNGLCCP